jgi:hypothetical protein
LISSDVPVAFQAVIENRGIEMVPGIEVEFLVDGEVQGSRMIDVEGGDGRTISFPHIFRLPGVARVEVRLRSDDLDRDDVRFFAAEVLEAVDVLVVDGGWDAVSESSESDWLVAALGNDEVGPTGVRLSPYRVEVIPEDRFHSADLASARVLVLADLSRMSEEISEKVEGFLKRGGGVLIFPEGTRSRDGRLGRLKGGVLKLARMARVPVVPAMVIGSDRALGRGHWIPRPVRVEIRFGDAIDFLDEQDEEKALTRLRRAMQSLVPEEPGTSVNAEA